MAITDKAAGLLLLALSAGIFLYYTMWVIITPFVDSDHAVQAYFPNRQIAIVIPAVLLVLLITLATSFIAWVMIKNAAKKKAKSQ